MKEFDYVIIGGGCAGLSLAYELELHQKLNDKTLAIVEPRTEYNRDKTWSFWKVFDHNFEDCIKKSWKEFSIKTSFDSKVVKCDNFPYQSIDSGLFYRKINERLAKNKNIKFFKNIENYSKAGKIYVPAFGKIIETILSIGDFLKLLFAGNTNYSNDDSHSIIKKEINLDERI